LPGLWGTGETRVTFAERLIALQLASGLTKAELGRRTGIHGTQIHGYEVGRSGKDEVTG
jgi:hypothetical protein